MRISLLRSHWHEFDMIWLADCSVGESGLDFGFGYFHKRLSSEQILSDRIQTYHVKLPDNLIDLERARIVTGGSLALTAHI